MRKEQLIRVIILLLLTSPAFATTLSGCTNISSPGTYLLTADITDTSIVTACMIITANNVTLDCQNHIIKGMGAMGPPNYYAPEGIRVNANNVVVQNCNLQTWANGLYLAAGASNNVFNSITSNGMVFDGVFAESSCTNNLFNRITTNSNGNEGIFFWGGSTSNNFTNIVANGNSEAGILLGPGSNNVLTNITANSNGNPGEGIALDHNSNNILNNIEVENAVNIGIKLAASSNNIINGFSTHLNFIGIYFVGDHSSNNTITNSSISNSTGFLSCAFFFDSYGSVYANNSIYNNFLNDTCYADVQYLNIIHFSGAWNTTQQDGSRIFSAGTQIGGNYYANPSGTGYSQNCTDADHDGFCDTPYDLCGGTCASNNTDFLPLSDHFILHPKGAPALALTADSWIQYQSISDQIRCAVNDPEVTPLIYLNGTLQSNPFNADFLAVGNYAVTCNTSATQNYSSASTSQPLKIMISGGSAPGSQPPPTSPGPSQQINQSTGNETQQQPASIVGSGDVSADFIKGSILGVPTITFIMLLISIIGFFYMESQKEKQFDIGVAMILAIAFFVILCYFDIISGIVFDWLAGISFVILAIKQF